MAKLSRKKRKLLSAEKPITARMKKMGKPYSNKTIHKCIHYVYKLTNINRFGIGIYDHILVSCIGEDCVCSRCKHKFTESEKHKLDKFIEFMNDDDKNPKLFKNHRLCLPPDIDKLDPIKYYYDAPDVIIEVNE